MDSFKIIANPFLITCDPQDRGGRLSLLIRNDRIAGVAERADLLKDLHPEAAVIDASNKLVIPGFVNAHFHSESIALRPQTDNLHYALWETNPVIREWTREFLDPLSKDHIRNIYLMTYFSHLKSGTTCVGEYGLPLGGKEFAQALHAIERTEVKTASSLQNWEQIQMAEEWKGGPHCFFVNAGKEEEFTVYSFENLLRAAKELNVPLLAHVAEQRAGAELIRKTFQTGILAVLQNFGILQPQTVLVHLNHLGNKEAGVLAGMGCTVVVCARSAAFKRTGYPFLRYLSREHIRLAVGTDWGNVDMLEELRFLLRLHLLISGIPPLSPLQLVRMGTINGASALGLSHETGSIEVGKKADLTFYSLDDLRVPRAAETAGAEDLASLLLNHLTNRDVSDVMINGDFYVAKGQVMTMAEEEILDLFGSAVARLSRGADSPAPQADFSGPPPKILPFTSGSRNAQAPGEGFELGFHVAEPPPAGKADQEKPQAHVSPIAGAKEEANRPPGEKPKEVWRTFGEEDF